VIQTCIVIGVETLTLFGIWIALGAGKRR